MKVTLAFILLVLGSCGEKANRLHEINHDIDSLQHQFVELMGSYNLDTYDSITPMIEKNIQLRITLINKADSL